MININNKLHHTITDRLSSNNFPINQYNGGEKQYEQKRRESNHFHS